MVVVLALIGLWLIILETLDTLWNSRPPALSGSPSVPNSRSVSITWVPDSCAACSEHEIHLAAFHEQMMNPTFRDRNRTAHMIVGWSMLHYLRTSLTAYLYKTLHLR